MVDFFFENLVFILVLLAVCVVVSIYLRVKKDDLALFADIDNPQAHEVRILGGSFVNCRWRFSDGKDSEGEPGTALASVKNKGV